MRPRIDNVRDTTALTVLISVLMISPWVLGGRLPWYAAASSGLLVAVAAAWLALALATGGPIRGSRMYAPLAVFLAWAGSAWLAGSSVNPHATATAVTSTAACAAAFGLAHQLGASPRRAKMIVRSIAWTGVAVAVAALAQKTMGAGPVFGLVDDPYGGAAFGPFNNRNYFAALMLVAMGPWMARVLGRDARSRWLAWLATGIGAIAIAASMSRGGVLALALAALVGFAAAERTQRFRVATIAAFALLVVLAGWMNQADRIAGELESLTSPSSEVSVSKRLWIWSDAIEMIPANPVAGTGLGTFATAFASHRTQPDSHVTLHAHNEALELLVETGIVGLLLATTFVALLLARLATGLTTPAGARRPIVLGALLGCVGLLAFSFVDLPTVSPAVNYALATLGGVGVARAQADPCRLDNGK